jgi:hypothetical protein
LDVEKFAPRINNSNNFSLLKKANHVKVEDPIPPPHITFNSPIPNPYSTKKYALKIFKIDKK